MEGLDLKSADGLKSACLKAEVSHAKPAWRAKLTSFVETVRSASLAERSSEAFHQRLWEDNPVSGAGMGRVKVEPVIANKGFRRWLAEQSLRELPGDEGERTAALNDLYKETLERLAPLCDRTPRLKLFRILAAFFPADFTTLAYHRSLRRLLAELGVAGKIDPVIDHRRVLARLAEVLGPVDTDDTDAVVRRMMLPWMLTALVDESDPLATTESIEGGQARLKPLPAARRRKGMTSGKWDFKAMLSILEFVQDKPSREELMDYIRTDNPDYKDGSIKTQINVLQSEFNILRREGDSYELTNRGRALLETADPDELRDWLLTRILGVDHTLTALSNGPLSRGDLMGVIRKANPNWTTNYVPSSITQWLFRLDLLTHDKDKNLTLSERGRAWSDWVYWEPENLAPSEPEPIPVSPPSDSDTIMRPKLETIVQRIESVAVFSDKLVASLHWGLWTNQRRHFAILTGLSGSGKTLLAREYAKALTETTAEASEQLCTLPVQPGWYDPTPLLGYVNPLRGDTYEGTPFLDLLIHAVEHPKEPHVAILDEMNLSHPEQYLAPLLSAMETGDVLELHSKGNHFDGVPGNIPYPNNLVLIGTVNMDETTLGLSDKILDRAFTLEFWDINIDQWPGWGSLDLPDGDESSVRQVLNDLMDALKPARLHFGWRVVAEVAGFMQLRESEKNLMPLTEALDQVIYAKLLPKLRGEDSQRFREALAACAGVLESHGLTTSLAKVAELKSDLDTMGSARFWR